MAKIEDKLKGVNFSDIDYEVIEDDEISEKVLSVAEQKRIVRQVNEEFDMSYKFNEAKRKTTLARLKLYNNQKRDPEAVGDSLMFTVFQTIHASLWDDRLMATWEGRGGKGDEDIEENLNALTDFDYDIMQKAELDYEWNFDTEFVGRGLVLMMDFDRTEGIMAPIPEVVDAMSWIRDPDAKSVNGDMRGRGAMRYGGREIGMTYWEMKEHPGYFNISALKKGKDTKSLGTEVAEARNEAQGRENAPQRGESLSKYGNYEFQLLEWFTQIRGKKYLVTLGNERTTIVRYQRLDYNGKWPIVDRTLYPMAKDWDGVSVPDLTEDKQRARAVLLNIGLVSAKAEVTPTYLFDKTRIKNKNDLNFRINKFIGVDGRVDGAMSPVQKSTAHAYASLIMDALDAAAQRATATPEIQQGVQSKSQRTLGELELVSSKVDTRYSMSAKLYGISDAKFWRLYYLLYKKHFKDGIDEKVVRIQGALAPIFRPLSRDNIIALVDPDVKITSKVISEQKRLRDQTSYTNFATFALQDPETNRRFVLKKMAKLSGMPKEEVDMVFPPTIDELHAEDENNLLNKGKLPPIDARDDHKTHIEIHSKAEQNPTTLAHVRAHKRLMLVRRNRPDLFPAPQLPNFPSNGAEQIGQGKPVPATQTQ